MTVLLIASSRSGVFASKRTTRTGCVFEARTAPNRRRTARGRRRRRSPRAPPEVLDYRASPTSNLALSSHIEAELRRRVVLRQLVDQGRQRLSGIGHDRQRDAPPRRTRRRSRSIPPRRTCGRSSRRPSSAPVSRILALMSEWPVFHMIGRRRPRDPSASAWRALHLEDDRGARLAREDIGRAKHRSWSPQTMRPFRRPRRPGRHRRRTRCRDRRRSP